MPHCEDYPCCGHGPEPYGDGGGCPDEQGRFKCVLCGRKLKKDHYSSICGTKACRERSNRVEDEDSFFYEG